METLQSKKLMSIAILALAAAEILLFGFHTAVYAFAVALIFLIFLLLSSLSTSNVFSTVVLPLAVAVLAVAAHKIFSELAPFPKTDLDEFQDSTPFAAIIGIISTLYVVSIAFLLGKAVQRHSALNSSVQSKTTKLVLVLDNLMLLDPEEKSDLEDADGEYFRSSEFSMRTQLLSYLYQFKLYLEKHAKKQAEESLRGALLELRYSSAQLKPKPGDANDENAIDQIIKGLDAIGDKSDEISSSLKDSQSSSLMAFICIISMVCVSFFFKSEFSLGAPTTYAVFVMSFLFSYLFVLLIDMNDLFRGQWTIDRTCIDDALENERLKSWARARALGSAVSKHMHNLRGGGVPPL